MRKVSYRESKVVERKSDSRQSVCVATNEVFKVQLSCWLQIWKGLWGLRIRGFWKRRWAQASFTHQPIVFLSSSQAMEVCLLIPGAGMVSSFMALYCWAVPFSQVFWKVQIMAGFSYSLAPWVADVCLLLENRKGHHVSVQRQKGQGTDDLSESQVPTVFQR